MAQDTDTTEMPGTLRDKAIESLLNADIGNMAPAEAYILGWRDGWDDGLGVAIDLLRRELPDEKDEERP